MEFKFSGKIWKLPDDVDTDTIIAGRHGVLPTAKDMSVHCLETLRPELASREQAPACIAALGIKCIIAKSFARIFYRNGINNGMLLIESKDVPDNCQEGDIVTVEVNKKISVKGIDFAIPAIPENLFEIIRHGGLVNCYRMKNEAKELERQ
jgi:3-isopropylmalate dehydratase small subunit